MCVTIDSAIWQNQTRNVDVIDGLEIMFLSISFTHDDTRRALILGDTLHISTQSSLCLGAVAHPWIV